VNPDSIAYKAGALVGQALNIVFMVNPGALGSIGVWLLNAGVVGGVQSAIEAAWHRDYVGAALLISGTGSKALSGMTPCVAGWVGIGVGVVATGQSLASAYNNFTQPGGDPLAGILDVIQAAVTFKVQVASSCFTARMLMRTAEGKKRVDSIRVGDLVWSRDEHDPYGTLVD